MVYFITTVFLFNMSSNEFRYVVLVNIPTGNKQNFSITLKITLSSLQLGSRFSKVSTRFHLDLHVHTSIKLHTHHIHTHISTLKTHMLLTVVISLILFVKVPIIRSVNVRCLISQKSQSHLALYPFLTEKLYGINPTNL